MKTKDGREVRPIGIAHADAGVLDAILSEHTGAWDLVVLVDHEDRYGRLVGHVVGDQKVARQEVVQTQGTRAFARDKEGFWLQGDLIASGHALVHHRWLKEACLNHLIHVEKKAKSAKLGHWRSGKLHTIDANNLNQSYQAIGSYQIIRGQVHRVSRVGKRIYVNFEENWRKDTSIMVPASVEKKLAKHAINLFEMEGEVIEARGFLVYKGGPMIEIQSAGQLWFPRHAMPAQ